ncbi:FKBP-like protein [Xylariomycetidae sp. FL2044]|nr:FKBP-like protein [Xylariomycetidae sp. FL2044]
MGAKKKGDDKSGKSNNNTKDGGKGGKNAKGADDKKGDGGKVKGAQSLSVRHILCQKHSKKEEALAKIKANDPPTLDNFIAVAREYDEDKPRQGGQLGWKTKGSLDPAFEEIAYALQTSKGSQLYIGEAKTSFGYHLIVVEGRK